MRKRGDFLAARDGRKTGTRAFLLVRHPRNDASSSVRVGLTVTKKIGSAVLRNRIKRRLRAACRAVLPLHAEPGCDYVLVARGAAATIDFEPLCEEFAQALRTLARSSR